jgi:serine/threonine-protein kinase
VERIGAYEVLGEIGRGGAGVVYRVRHVKLGVVRALKILTDASSPTLVERFIRELELLGRVGSEGIVPVHEAGVLEGRPYYVMELMKGSLRDRLDTGGRFDWREAAAIVRDLALALDRCHQAGFIHRDIKPDNVLFDEHGTPRLADFGAAHDERAVERLTRTGTLIGTFDYMPPEQLEGKKVDGRADVYALGVVLHELVTGSVPYATGSLMALLAAVNEGRRERASTHGAPPDLDGVIARALAPRRHDRTPGPRALADELEALLEARPRSRRLALLLPLGVVALGALALALLALAAGPAPPPPPPVPAPPKAPPAPPPPPAPRLPPGFTSVSGRVFSWPLPKGAGTIEMVRVTDFFVAQTEVTWRAYRAFCQATRHEEPPAQESWEPADEKPVAWVSWHDARAFCGWAGLRLPTVAEWRRAAQGETERPYPWGVFGPDDTLCAWKGHSVYGDRGPAAVGSFIQGASPWGALDMAGNVREWCDDDGGEDTGARISMPTKAVRGGSFRSSDHDLETGATDSEPAWSRLPDLGFRPVRSGQ